MRKGTELTALREGGLMSALYNLGWQVHDYGDVNRNNGVNLNDSFKFLGSGINDR